MKLANSKDIDGVVEDEYAENYGICDIQTHLTLAMIGVDDDVVSNSTPSQSLDLSPAKKPWNIICMGVTTVQPALFVWALQKGGKLCYLCCCIEISMSMKRITTYRIR